MAGCQTCGPLDEWSRKDPRSAGFGQLNDRQLSEHHGFHPFAKWSLQEKTNRSRSQNSHLWEKELQGQVKLTMHAGRIVYEA